MLLPPNSSVKTYISISANHRQPICYSESLIFLELSFIRDKKRRSEVSGEVVFQKLAWEYFSGLFKLTTLFHLADRYELVSCFYYYGLRMHRLVLLSFFSDVLSLTSGGETLLSPRCLLIQKITCP